MACLVPQFKCPASSDANSRIFHHSLHSTSAANARILVRFETHCTASQMTAVIEKLHMPTMEAHPFSLTCMSPLTYVGAVGPPENKIFEANLTREEILTSEEAVIAAAAAEAITLAKAALKFAKAAALLLQSSPSLKYGKTNEQASGEEKLRPDGVKRSVSKKISRVSHSVTEAETEPKERNLTWHQSDSQRTCISNFETDELDARENITVRSLRHIERRVRREKIEEKAAASVISTKLWSPGKKKRAGFHEVDYSDPLRYLRGMTSTAKLLTASEEQQLSEGIQDMLKLERIQDELAERISDEPTFAQWATAAGLDKKALKKRLNHGRQCKDKMIKSNIRLVISIAKNFQSAGMSLQDLVQEGCRGLLRGAEKFDASKGYKFSTYAHWWIRQSVRKSLSEQSRTIRLPFHMVEATYRVREARKQLYRENGRHPNNEEVAKAAGLSMRRLATVLLTPKAPTSLDQKIGFNQSLKLSEVIADPAAQTSEEILMRQFMKLDLNKALDSLNQREKQVVKSRFGLENGRMNTLQEIGEMMGVSRERIRQIESCAFRKLKNKKRTKNLRHYLYS
ncbi:RNA polymerase sigma factor sigB [Dendrobium catenatum]|uniref:RNA polymerase sigma factor n=1 Tax=Dendrobium catenatum TaxID=906689 RepID=A0A2I0WIJ8_9ASPA|nr:RNA polymerase sigma factor sigB [Dendrobium catenatum]PKU75481.1 RNA polymerase sigma factor sigB [Dendrobium catenatum]